MRGKQRMRATLANGGSAFLECVGRNRARSAVAWIEFTTCVAVPSSNRSFSRGAHWSKRSASSSISIGGGGFTLETRALISPMGIERPHCRQLRVSLSSKGSRNRSPVHLGQPFSSTICIIAVTPKRMPVGKEGLVQPRTRTEPD